MGIHPSLLDLRERDREEQGGHSPITTRFERESERERKKEGEEQGGQSRISIRFERERPLTLWKMLKASFFQRRSSP